MKCFFPGEGERSLRMLLVAGLFSDDFEITAISESPVNILRQLFQRDFYAHPAAPFLLPGIKGINYFYFHEFKSNVSVEIFQLIHSLPVGTWVSFENIKRYLTSHFINIELFGSWHRSV